MVRERYVVCDDLTAACVTRSLQRAFCESVDKWFMINMWFVIDMWFVQSSAGECHIIEAYGVALVSRIDKITGLFCQRDP